MQPKLSIKLRPFTLQYFQMATDAVLNDPRLPKEVARTLRQAHCLVKTVFDIEVKCASPDVGGLARPPKQAQSSVFASKFTDRGYRRPEAELALNMSEAIMMEPKNATVTRILPMSQMVISEEQALLGLVSMLQSCKSHAAGLWATARG